MCDWLKEIECFTWTRHAGDDQQSHHRQHFTSEFFGRELNDSVTSHSSIGPEARKQCETIFKYPNGSKNFAISITPWIPLVSMSVSSVWEIQLEADKPPPSFVFGLKLSISRKAHRPSSALTRPLPTRQGCYKEEFQIRFASSEVNGQLIGRNQQRDFSTNGIICRLRNFLELTWSEYSLNVFSESNTWGELQWKWILSTYVGRRRYRWLWSPKSFTVFRPNIIRKNYYWAKGLPENIQERVRSS